MTTKVYLNNNQFFKPNYYKAIDYIIPKFIPEDERAEFGEEVDYADQLINTHIDFASSVSSYLSISSVPGTIYSAIGTLNGIAPYFIKQNNLSVITPKSFELNVLNRVGESLYNYQTSSEFSDYLTNTLLPAIRLNNLQSYWIGSNSVSSSHIDLIENLSWLYFLNTSGTQYNPSSFVKDILVSKIYKGEKIYLNNCLQGLSEYLWKNNVSSLIPSVFLSGTSTYLSGTQQLDNLKTWIDVVYSPLHADRSDFTVRDRFELFIDSQDKIRNKVVAGPIAKLVRALSFAMFDLNNDTEILKSAYDIEDCPDEYLPFLANLIGWNLFGSNPQRWRLQLRNAVDIYKSVGTKRSLQFALNSVFPKDIFDIESRIAELWESYVPYLIYYSLATESDYFKDNDTWTPDLASRMNVGTYSYSSLDENLRLATDRIVYETYSEFSSSFHIPNKDNNFNYRGREYPIPPFEEYPYYVNTELSTEMINFITDRLACFGVRKEFALQFRDYVIENTIEVDEELRSSSWLFFTSGHNSPPNLSNLVTNLTSKKFEYVPLWSGKSSHFKLLFDATEFDFTDIDDDNPDSGDAIVIASKIVNEFSPAHAIPLINLRLSSTDTVGISYDELPIISLNEIETPENFKPLMNYQSSGLNINAYKRNNTTGNKFSRSSLTSLRSSLLTGASVATDLSRTSHRRRSYEKLMPFNGFYDRTGLNQPVSWDPSSSLSGIPLGFIPSSLSFQDIDDYNNLPEVYHRCNDINSSASYFGYNVSNALKSRGHIELGTRDYYCDRGQLPDIYAVMHDVAERRKVLEASALATSTTLLELTWKNSYQSLANQYTESSGWFPNSQSDYYNFRFGRDPHTLYQTYTKEFDRHRLSEDLHYIDGANLFSHTFGPLLYNHDFNVFGSNGSTYATTAVSAPIEIRGNESVFYYGGPGTFVASSTSSMYIDRYEFVNSSILDGVELVQTSGAPLGNIFEILRLPSSGSTETTDDYLFGRTFVKIKTVGGNPRLRFDISKYAQSSNLGYPIQRNFLLPEHKYKLSLKSLVTNREANFFGGATIGVWIHTKPESGVMWSYKDGWKVHTQLITKSQLYNDFANLIAIPPRDESQNSNDTSTSGLKLKCIEIEAGTSGTSDAFLQLKDSDFTTNELYFNTINREIEVPDSYFKYNGQVNRKLQNYIVELFIIPNPQKPDLFFLLDKVEIQNLTMKKNSEVLALDTCPQYRVDLSKEQLQQVFKFWNDISGKNSNPGLATRYNMAPGDDYRTGGSRLDYRLNKDWVGIYEDGTGYTKYYQPLGDRLIIQNISIRL
jgi:hypothetical protein